MATIESQILCDVVLDMYTGGAHVHVHTHVQGTTHARTLARAHTHTHTHTLARTRVRTDVFSALPTRPMTETVMLTATGDFFYPATPPTQPCIFFALLTHWFTLVTRFLRPSNALLSALEVVLQLGAAACVQFRV